MKYLSGINAAFTCFLTLHPPLQRSDFFLNDASDNTYSETSNENKILSDVNFFYNYIVLILCGSRDLSQQLLTTSQFSQQSKPKLYKWAISIWALNPWFQAAKLLWRGKGYREKGLQ